MIRGRTLSDGVTAGVAAGAAVIVLFLFYDVVRMSPLATPFELSSVLFGAEGPAPGLTERSRLGPIVAALFRVLAYTGFHLAVFAALGVGAAWLSRRLGRPLSLVSGAAYGLVVCTTVLYVAFALLWPRLTAPAVAGVLVANALAGVVMALMLRRPEESVS